MSSNPLGDAFYDDDGVSVASSEFRPPKSNTISDEASQPYYSNPQPPEPDQYEAALEIEASDRVHEQDDRYVQPEQKQRPAQSAPPRRAVSSDPHVTVSAPTPPVTKGLAGRPVKSAVIVQKSPSGQSKLSKARAAARRAAMSSTIVSAVAKPQEPKASQDASAMSEPGKQSKLKEHISTAKNASQPGQDKTTKAKPTVRKSPAKKIEVDEEVLTPKLTEQTSAEQTESQSQLKPYIRRAAGKSRISSADKMRAERGMRVSKGSR